MKTEQEQISGVLANAFKLESAQIESLFETPADRSMGDLALPCFKLAGTLKRAPQQIAQEGAAALAGNLPDGVLEANAVGPYLNFRFDPGARARRVLGRILAEGENYGSSEIGAGRTIVLDFSSPNIAKPFNIGHLRSTVIGHATANLLKFLGYPCVRINHLGDWGTQFGKLMTAYEMWGSEVDLEGDDPIQALLDLYVRFHNEAEKDSSLEDRGRAWFKKLEDGDSEAERLWNRFKELSLKEFQRIYDRLGVEFDFWSGEAFYNDKMGRVIERLQEKGLLQESRGAKIVDLEPYGLNPVLIQRSDDATLYATRDLAAAYYRRETYNFHKNLYFVATQQNEHFQQVFKVLELLGETWAKDCVHVAFGMISFAEGTMSTRKGKVIFLEDVLDQAVERVKKIIEEKNPDLADPDKVAEQVGVGAIVFYDLSRRRIKDWTFDWNRILNFDGETGPYVMYSHARFRSILRKGEDRNFHAIATAEELDFGALDSEEGGALIQSLENFPDAVERAAEQYEPSILSQALVEISDRANKFYNAHHVLVEDAKVAGTRLLLVQAVATVLKGGLHLLGIEAPEEM
jgi:arginyl-tRNA synthetase